MVKSFENLLSRKRLQLSIIQRMSIHGNSVAGVLGHCVEASRQYGIGTKLKPVFLVCTLYEEERGSLFQCVGEGWSEVDKMRVVLGFSDEKGREVLGEIVGEEEEISGGLSWRYV